MAGYQKNTWQVYDYTIPFHEQPNAIITKAKLDNIENGIEKAVTDFKIGNVSKGDDAYCEIITDENDPSIKKINMVIPKEVSWVFSEVELYDNSVAPIGISINDMILDSKGNIFTVIQNENGVYLLNKRLNIKGERGDIGTVGPEGKSGSDGKDGVDGNKMVYFNTRLYDGDQSPEGANIGDYVIDNTCDVFEVLDNLTIKKIFNIQGIQGPEGPTGPAGKSTYDIWKALGNDGDANEFLESLKGEQASVIDSLESTSTTEALSANQGRILKNNRLTTLEEVLANEKEGIFVDALVVKELYLKMLEIIENIKS